MGLSEFLEGISGGIEDIEEVIKLEDDFRSIKEVQDYLEEHEEELDDVGIIDVLSEPKEVQKKFKAVDDKILQADLALIEIRKTKLKFSKEYLGETIEDLDDALDDLNGISVGILHDIVDPKTWKGKMAKKVLSEKKMKEVTALSLELKNLESDIREMRSNLAKLIDPKLKEPSNNKLVNKYLEGKKSYDRIANIIDTIRKIREAKRRVADLF